MPTRLLTIKQAADALGVSENTIRRRINAGKLPAQKVPTAQGYEWRVELPTEGEQVPTQGEQTLTQLEEARTQPGEQVPTEVVNQLATDALIQELRRLHDQNVQLAGQLGYVQAQLQQAQEQIRLLTADKAAEPEQPAEETEPESEPEQPWWRRLWRKL